MGNGLQAVEILLTYTLKNEGFPFCFFLNSELHAVSVLDSERLNGKLGTISPLKMSMIPQGTQTINSQKSDVCCSMEHAGHYTYLMQGGGCQ